MPALVSSPAPAASPSLTPARSRFEPLCHPLMEEVAAEVDGYFLQHWNLENDKAKKKFLDAGFSRVTCLYFPKALNDRIHFACRLLTVLFLIDGKWSMWIQASVRSLQDQTSSRICLSKMAPHTTKTSSRSPGATSFRTGLSRPNTLRMIYGKACGRTTRIWRTRSSSPSLRL